MSKNCIFCPFEGALFSRVTRTSIVGNSILCRMIIHANTIPISKFQASSRDSTRVQARASSNSNLAKWEPCFRPIGELRRVVVKRNKA